MKTIVMTWLALVLVSLGISPTQAADPMPRSGIAACEVMRPQGSFARVWLEFDIPGAPVNKSTKWSYLGSMRNGRMEVDDVNGMREPGGILELKDGKLSGSFGLCHTRPGWQTAQFSRISVDATVTDGVIQGAATMDGKTGTVTGQIMKEEDLRKANAVARDKAWPAFQGPVGGGCASQPGGGSTRDSMEGWLPTWRSEARTPAGCGTTSRAVMGSLQDATGFRTAGNSSSVIAADGCVFMSFFVPAPVNGFRPDSLKAYQEQIADPKNERLLAAQGMAGIGEDPAKWPERVREKIYSAADDHVICLDAATGQLLWRAVVKGRGTNHQHHKEGPFNMTPAYANGRLFALGKSGWLYAFDARDGKPLWEVESVADYSNALLAVGQVVVAPCQNCWGGYDAATGKLLWKTPWGRSYATLTGWSAGGKDYLLGASAPFGGVHQLHCIEAATGAAVWSVPMKVVSTGRGAGPGGITVSGDTLVVYRDDQADPKSRDFKPVLAAYRLTTAKPELLWEIADPSGATDPISMTLVHGESVPVVLHGKYVFTPDLRTINLATGKEVAKGPADSRLRPFNGGYMQGIGDIVMARGDGTHGAIQVGFYKIGQDGSIRLLNPQGWTPSGSKGTSSYHHPMMWAMVDGRMFVRQDEAVFCWDLRAMK